MAIQTGDPVRTRNDLAWAITAGGIGIVLFTALLLFAWHYSATLFLIFAGMLLGVALNAMSNQLGRLVNLPHALRLTFVCLAVAALLSGVVFLGGTTIAQQATALSDTIKTQLVNLKTLLDKNGIDTSYFELGNQPAAPASDSSSTPTPRRYDNPQPAERGRDRFERGRDRQSRLQIPVGHGERCRELFYRFVSWSDLCGAARRLSKRATVSGACRTSWPRCRDR